MAVGPKERVVQLQVGKRHILLGVTANNVNFLMDLTEPEEPEEPKAKPTAPYTRAEFDRFAAQFMAYMQEQKASAAGGVAGGAAGVAAAGNAAFSEVFAQAYDRTTQAAQAAGLMDTAAPAPGMAPAESPDATPVESAAQANTAKVIEALKNTPWVADTELAPDDSETLPPLPEGLTKGTTPEEIPSESAKDKRSDAN